MSRPSCPIEILIVLTRSCIALGLGAGALINLIIPQPTSPTTFAPRTHAALARATGEDENAARRGQAIDEGVIIDEEDDEEDATPIGKGRRKEE